MAEHEYIKSNFASIDIVTPETAKTLDNISARILPRKGKAEWSRATLLKWEVFREWEYEEILFLDADMLCLGEIMPLFDIFPDSDIVTVPQFRKELQISETGDKVSSSELCSRLLAMNNGDFAPNGWNSVNSGVMILRKSALTSAFRRELNDYSMNNRYVNEQRFLNEFFKTGERSVRFVPSIWNFQCEFIWRMTLSEQLQVLSGVRILHFAGRMKPWRRSVAPEDHLGACLWHWARAHVC